MRAHFLLILAATVFVLLLKTFVNALTTFIIGFPLHTMLLIGFSLAQIGEFSLIIANVGFASGILSREIYQEFLAIIVLSMVLTPFFTGLGYRSVIFSQRLSLPKILLYNRYGNFQEEEQGKELENHLIIIGFGINGRNVSIAADEFESSIELFSKVLSRYMVPRDEIEAMGEELRADHYRMLRSPEVRRKNICELALDFSDVEIRSIRVGKYSEAAGKTLGNLDLRKKYGVSILAISRNHGLIYDLRAETELNPDDIILIISPPQQLEEIGSLFESRA